jgi:hypothetical protein
MSDKETPAEMVDRVKAMIADDGDTWDLSDNDREALRHVLAALLYSEGIAERVGEANRSLVAERDAAFKKGHDMGYSGIPFAMALRVLAHEQLPPSQSSVDMTAALADAAVAGVLQLRGTIGTRHIADVGKCRACMGEVPCSLPDGHDGAHVNAAGAWR